MSTIKTYRVLCMSEAVSPITHMRGVEGNESLVNREPVVTPRGTMMVPFLSGNAIRHRCVREPGARWLVESYGMAGKLRMEQLYFLFNGGTLTMGSGRENTRRIADMQRLFPLIRLLGGSLPDQILSGSMLAGRGTLVCEENLRSLSAMLPDGFDVPAHLRPAESFVSGYQYVRGQVATSAPDLLNPDGFPGDSGQMIYSGQAVTRGAIFLHDFHLLHVSDHELGALLWSLRLWQAAGGTVGGMAAKGHGRLKTSVWIDADADADGLVESYKSYALSVRDDALGWLEDAFRFTAEDMEPKGKKGKKAKAAALGAAIVDGEFEL